MAKRERGGLKGKRERGNKAEDKHRGVRGKIHRE